MADANFKPTDLLGIKVVKGKDNEEKVVKNNLSFTQAVAAYFSDFSAMLNFKSNLVEEYFLEISYNHLRRHLRKILKYSFIFVFSLLIIYPILYPGNYEKYSTISIISSILHGLHLMTIIKFKPQNYEYLLLLTFCLLLMLDIYMNSNLLKPRELHFSCVSNMIFYVIAIIQVNVKITIIVALFYIAILPSFTYHRLLLIANEYNASTNSQLYKYTVIYFTKSITITENFTLGQGILYMTCLISGLYLHLTNRVRRKLSFLRLGGNVKSQRQVKNALRDQMKFIETIMPAVIKDSYWSECKANVDQQMWVFCKCFENVSILFADIVGFTNMSSNKTAPQVVTLLNDLFNRFDMMCDLTRCEKLGTLGDCYYCVSGCPISRNDHATNCIEMGLGMCRIIKHFNRDYQESVNMRVGIHTGRVNAAIIGNIRFRFDVYSNDVLIANQMESSGLPGRVHVSEATYESSKDCFEFEQGSILQIKREIHSGIAGLKLTIVNLETYFVISKSSHLRKATKHIEKGGEKSRIFSIPEDGLEKVVKSASAELSYSGSTKIEIDTSKELSNDNANRMLVEALRRDPNQLINLFNFLPVHPVSLRFLDPEIENQYLSHTRLEIKPLHIDSVKLCSLTDSILCIIFFTFIVGALSVLFPDLISSLSYYFILMYLIAMIILVIMAWNTINLEPLLENDSVRKLFLFTSHPCTINVLLLILCSLPMWAVLLVYDCKRFILDHLYTASFFALTYFSGICYGISVTSFWWVNTIGGFLNYALFGSLFLINNICVEDIGYADELIDKGHCQGSQLRYKGRYWLLFIISIYFEYIQIFYCVLIMNRENEKNLRLCFYVTREAQIRSDAAHKAMLDAEELLHNIIPEYALKTIEQRSGNLLRKDFSYAENISNAAVIFACISNFFSQYYREDYKGGEGALKMLNKIICLFDDSLKQSKYRDVEKIKSINDCYMVASGLNMNIRSKDSKRHLKALMKYCFEMYAILQVFNEEFVFGKDKFEMKIGYNIGPVTAGIIGTTKPLYDIWGDTVNVASRMYSTASSGIIQAPTKVKEALGDYFTFTYRDKVVVKGKGEMETYIVTENTS